MASKAEQAKYAALLKLLGKRPKAVLEKILANGSVSTYELGKLGYDQPPRAAQDLKEYGVRLQTTFGKHPNSGARMAIYSLADQQDGLGSGLQGRQAFPKAFRTSVIEKFQGRCNICNSPYPSTVLQLDHRIPYIVGGEADSLTEGDFQPLCGSHQRKKSWECEHCGNREGKDLTVCRSCYWAYPDGDYTHVAMRGERRLDISWIGEEEIAHYDFLRDLAKHDKQSLSELVKATLVRNRKK